MRKNTQENTKAMIFAAWLGFVFTTMPPKLGSHSGGAQLVADDMYNCLESGTGGIGQPSFAAGVLAFSDMPGVTNALGFDEGTPSLDILTAGTLLANMKHSFKSGPLASRLALVTKGKGALRSPLHQQWLARV